MTKGYWELRDEDWYFGGTDVQSKDNRGMAERLKAPVLKTEEEKSSVGSNPTPSARIQQYCPKCKTFPCTCWIDEHEV